jgi:hypothetical protein
MRLTFLGICVLGFFSFGTLVNAAANTKAPKNAVAEKGLQKIISGPVTMVNVEKKEIAVERNGKQYPISIDGSTQIVSGNNPIALENIKTGDLVTISYQKASDGRRIALNIINKSVSTKEVKAEAKKETATKAEVKAEAKKETTTQAEVKAEAKKESAIQAEVKAEAKKETATKAEVKADAKKETATKMEVKAEAKKESATKAEVKAEAKKESATKAEVKAEAKKDSVAAQQK